MCINIETNQCDDIMKLTFKTQMLSCSYGLQDESVLGEKRTLIEVE